MSKFTFYFLGHNYEYEARNALRVFDLNIDCVIKNIEEIGKIGETGFEINEGAVLISVLEERRSIAVGKAFFYLDGKLLYKAEYKSSKIFLECDDPKKLKKILIEKSIHSVLKKYYKVTPDYGILTGVRVIKILVAAKRYGRTDDEADTILRNTYEVTDDKIKLLHDILSIEEKYMGEKNKKNYNLYLGIPFCPSKCSYCSFTSFTNCKEDKINEYIKTLIYETEETIKMALKKGLNLHTVYVGGGTPSVLNESQINEIFNSIRKYYNFSEIEEVTFEAGRPDTLTERKLACLKGNGVTRICINPQTMNERTLQGIGRSHTAEDILNKYMLAKKIGFDCINMDIILGLPGEGEFDVKNTITKIIDKRPENITVHALAYKKKSELTRESRLLSKDYDLIGRMHEIVRQECKNAGYSPYYMYRQKNMKGNSENVGFTLPGRESIYNIIMIEELETTLGCGLGASSKIKTGWMKHEPNRNFKSLEEYEKRMNEIIEHKKELLKI